MQDSKLSVASSHELVANAVRGWIALGTYAPGERLPGERELAERFGVGRMTVRRAMREIASEGLVETSPGRSRGTVVLPGAPALPLETARDELLAAVRENFDFRRALEPMAASLVAERGDVTVGEELTGILSGTPLSFAAYRALDSRFHIAIAEASGNALIAEAVRASRLHFFGWADLVYPSGMWQELAPAERDFRDQHLAVAVAIASGRPREAADAMAEHIASGYAQYVRGVQALHVRRKSRTPRAAKSTR